MTGPIQFSKMTDIIKTIFGDNTINYGDFEEQWLTDEVKSAVEALFKVTSTQPKPKRARNPYIYFGIQNRAKVKADNPNMDSKEVTAELGRLWKACSDRSEYEALSAQDKIRYEEEMKTYTPPEGESKKDTSKPKGAKNPYIYFCMELRPQVKQKNPDMSTKEITAELGRLWGACDDKSKYEALSAEDKKRYNTEMKDYTPEGKSKSKSKGKKDPSKPKRTRSAYIYFGMMMRKVIKSENPDMDSKDITKEVARQWKECDDRTEYEVLSAQDKVRFEEEMKNYTPEGEESAKTNTKTTKPKRAKNAYIFFTQETTKRLREEDFGDHKEISEECRRLWKQLKREGGDELDRFKQMAEEAKQEFADNQESEQDETVATQDSPLEDNGNEDDKDNDQEDNDQEDSEDDNDDDDATEDERVEITQEKDAELFEEFYKFQVAAGYKPAYEDERRRKKLGKSWAKMTDDQKLAYENED